MDVPFFLLNMPETDLLLAGLPQKAGYPSNN